MPFGGYKQSGFGRDKSLHAMEKCTQLKSTWIQLSQGESFDGERGPRRTESEAPLLTVSKSSVRAARH